MNRLHEVRRLSFEKDRMRLDVDGREYVFDLKDISPRLLHASADERMRYEVSPSGYGIHWPLVDEDLSIDGLLGMKHHPPESGRRTEQGARTTSI
jgi:hypothetical protein